MGQRNEYTAVIAGAPSFDPFVLKRAVLALPGIVSKAAAKRAMAHPTPILTPSPGAKRIRPAKDRRSSTSAATQPALAGDAAALSPPEAAYDHVCRSRCQPENHRPLPCR